MFPLIQEKPKQKVRYQSTSNFFIQYLRKTNIQVKTKAERPQFKPEKPRPQD